MNDACAKVCVCVGVQIGNSVGKGRSGEGRGQFGRFGFAKFRNEHSEREILLELQKLGLKVFRLFLRASTVRSYSPDNTNGSCATWMGNDEPP